MAAQVKPIESFAEFQKLINGEKPVIIDFWATWCGPCKVISPVFVKLAAQYPTAEYYKVDVDEQEQISEEVGIRVMPTFIAFKNGAKLDSFSGANPPGLTEFVVKNSGA